MPPTKRRPPTKPAKAKPPRAKAPKDFVLQVRLSPTEKADLDRLVQEQKRRGADVPWGGGRSSVVRELMAAAVKKLD